MSNPTLHLSLHLFGGYSVRKNDLPLNGFRSDKTRALLAYLVLEGSEPIQRSHLAELLWAGYQSQTALNSLRVALNNIRHVIAPAPWLQTTHKIVQWNAPADQFACDALTMEQLLKPTTGGVNLVSVKQAIDALYRGEFLQGLETIDSPPFLDWLHHRRTYYRHWVEKAHSTLEKQTRGARRHLPRQLKPFIGREQEVAAICQLLQNPVNSMVTLVGEGGVGKTSLALMVANQLLQSFEDGVWFIPLMEVQGETSKDIAIQKSFVHGDLSGAPIENRGVSESFGGAPDRSFLGDDTPVETETHPSTASLLESPSTEEVEDRIAIVMAQVLSFPLVGNERPSDQVLAKLADKEMLLILDNFEHVTNARHFLLSILQESLGSKLLITSRHRLNLQCESLWPVQGLPVAKTQEIIASNAPALLGYSSVQLFIERAKRIHPTFQPDPQRDPQSAPQTLVWIAQICSLVEGLPLGIELAAALLETKTPSEILATLSRTTVGLESHLGDLAERHRSLRAVLTYSWQLLGEEERSLLMCCSFFRGGFTLEAMVALNCASPTALLGASDGSDTPVEPAAFLQCEATLRVLVEKSLVHFNQPVHQTVHQPAHSQGQPPVEAQTCTQTSPQTSPQTGRYWLHEFVRQFAEERIQDRIGEVAQIRNRYSGWYLNLLASQSEALQQNRQAQEVLEAEIDNIRQAWLWATQQNAIAQLQNGVTGLANYFSLKGLCQEALTTFGKSINSVRAWMESVPTPMDDAPDAIGRSETEAKQLIASLLLEQAYFYSLLAQSEEAEAAAQQAIRLAYELDNPSLEATSYKRLGDAAWLRGQYEKHQAHYQKALQLAQANHLISLEASCLNNLGMNADLQENYQQAIGYYQQTLRIAQHEQNRQQLSTTSNNLGVCHAILGDLGQASRYYQQALDISQALRDREGVAFADFNRSILLMAFGDWSQAERECAEAMTIFGEIGNRRLEARCLVLNGRLLFYRMREAEAEGQCLQALQMAESLGFESVYADALTVIGHIQTKQMRYQSAQYYYEHACASWSNLKRSQQLLVAQAGLANLLLLQKKHKEALLHSEVIVEALKRVEPSAIYEAGFIFLTGYRVLRANRDRRALPLLQQGYHLLQRQADTIENPVWQNTFWHRSSFNHEILVLYSSDS